MQKQTTQALKKAFIQQAHEQQPLITLAIFLKELDDDVEVSAWIVKQYGHDYDEATQMHMRNMLDAQLKMNAGTDFMLQNILKHVAEAGDVDAEEMLNKIKQPNVEQQAEQATKDLLTRMRLH